MTEQPDFITTHFDKAQNLHRAPMVAFGVRVHGEMLASRLTTTSFRIASMTKSFVAAAALKLRDAGLLRLDDPVAQVVPELASLRLPSDDSPQITIRHLLTMSAGFATDDAWADRQLDIDAESFSGWMRQGAFFATAPATEFVYSNYGYAMLGRVITNVSGMAFQRYVEQELLQPLGLHGTGWSPPSDAVAEPHRVEDGEVVKDQPAPLQDGEFAALGGLWSTVDDLMIWAQFLSDAFPARDGDDSSVLRRSSRREMQRLQQIADGKRFTPAGVDRALVAGYGMGLIDIRDPLLGRIVQHSGGLPGFGSNMSWLPGRDVQIVSLANVTYAPMWRVNLGLMEKLESASILTAVQPVDSAHLRSWAELLIDVFNDWSDEKADAVFAMNVALDQPYERRRRALQEFGDLRLVDVGAINAAEADCTVVDERSGDALRLGFTLSSQASPKIQSYVLTNA
jgi:CubicO group peptidase (beta-lactamase class C family)